MIETANSQTYSGAFRRAHKARSDAFLSLFRALLGK